MRTFSGDWFWKSACEGTNRPEIPDDGFCETIACSTQCGHVEMSTTSRENGKRLDADG